MMETLLLNGNDVRSLLTIEECIRGVEVPIAIAYEKAAGKGFGKGFISLTKTL